MQSDWRQVTLGEFVRLQRGHDLTASEQRPGQFPVMGSAGPNGTHAEFKAFGPGVVIGRSGASMGRVHFCETDYWPHNTCLYVTDFLENNPLFAFYKLAELNLARYNSGSAQPSLNRNYIYGMSLWIPSRHIQDQIVRVVHSIDKKIDLYHRINQTLEAMAQAIFQSWFVDFDPVKAKIAAKAEGRDPLRAAMSAICGKSDPELDGLSPEQYDLLAATAAMFPDEMKESELGSIPKEWTLQSAETLAEVGIGKTPPRKEPQWFTEGEGDWRWVSIRDMGASGVFQQRSSEFLTADAVSRFNVRVVPDRTVLLSFKLTIGRVAISDGPMVTNEAIAHFKLPSNATISSEYLYLYLKVFDYSTLGSTSSIADAVNSKTIRELPIVVASGDVIDRFTKSVAPLFEEMRNRQNEIASLGATRDALLPKLLSGEIEVPL